MKALITLTCAAVLGLTLHSCIGYYPANSNERISDIPTQPHQEEVQLFFSGEWPKQEYVKIAALEVTGGENTSYAALVKALRKRAQAYGADAVMVQDKNTVSDVSSSIYNRTVSTANTSLLQGIAIKYKKNLDLSLMPKRQELQLYNLETSSFQPLLNLQFSPGGEVKEQEVLQQKALDYYNRFVKRYSEHHLVKEQGNYWIQREQEGYVVERQQVQHGIILKQVEIEYDAARRITKILVKEPNTLQQDGQEVINYTYNEVGQLVSRRITRKKVPYLLEEYTYDDSGKVEQVQVYTPKAEGKAPFLKSDFAYYSLEEIN
ncbi:hypothetical protein ACFS7Z_05610 [Pontibacter toksunensis]|uniref:YD repeat-containing protein n=1 Tax=Pontibacter toksunensis TaxID=1332631 RepID=A0ABW6BRU3_9BACT